MLTRAEENETAELDRLRDIESRARELLAVKQEMARTAAVAASGQGTVIGRTLWEKEASRHLQGAAELSAVLGLAPANIFDLAFPDVLDVIDG